MQKKMYRCAEQWFQNYNEIIMALRDSGYLPSSNDEMDALAAIDAGKYRPLPPSPDLPSEFSLQDKMPPVYDQSGRGTCVAQAATALMEYYCDCKWRFSMQYLFERIKRLEKEKVEKATMEIANGKLPSDPKMAKEATDIIEYLQENNMKATLDNVASIMSKKKVSLSRGSNGYMAMEVLAKWGICTYEKWPYSRQLVDTTADVDVARPNMPPGADEEAALHRLSAPCYEFPAPNNVEEIKRYIAGADGNRPMPVMIGALTLNNLATDGDCVRLPKLKPWKVESAVCELTPVSAGKEGGFTYKMTSFDEATLNEEKPLLAMDMSITGGHETLLVGYKDDAGFAGGGYFIVRNSWDDTWGKDGYGRMPYAYVELFVDEACTIVQPMKHYAGSTNGAATYATPGIPDDLKVYVVKADSEQKDRAGRWTIAKGMLIIQDKDGLVDRYTEQNAMLFRRQGFSWTPLAQGAPQQKDDEADAATSPRLVLSSMEEQFFSGIEAAFGRKPLPFPQLGGLRKGWFSGTGEVEKFECSSDLSARFGNPLKIYKANGKRASFRIAALYIKDAANAGDAVAKARTLVKEFAAQHPFEPCACTIYAIGCNAPIAAVQPFVSESDVRIVLDNYTAEEGWRVSAASQPDDDALNEWLLRLAPNTPQQWSAQLLRAYQNVEATGGHVTLAKISKETGMAEELVAAAIAKHMPSLQVKGEQVTKR